MLRNLASQKDQMVPPSDHLASVSPKKQIKYNYQDWGKPINYYNNLKNAEQVPQEKDPQSQVHLNPIQFPFLKVEALANSFHMNAQEKQFLGFMFDQNFNQWICEHPEAKESEKDYAQNVIIHELVWRIKSIGTEMGDFINHNMQEVPWAEDHNQKYNHGMQNALNNLNNF